MERAHRFAWTAPILTALATLASFVSWPAFGAGNDAGPGRAAPAAHERCDSCHATSGPSPTGAAARPERSVEVSRAEIVARCVGCHPGVVSEPSSADEVARAVGGNVRVGHVVGVGSTRRARAPGGPVFEAFDCVSCHSPHPNGRAYQLREPALTIPYDATVLVDEVSTACLGCHRFGEFRDGHGGYQLHPIGLPASPQRVRGGPVTPAVDVAGTSAVDDDVIGCTTCHQVHSSANPDMLRWRPDQFAIACGNCHQQGRRAVPDDLLAVRHGGD